MQKNAPLPIVTTVAAICGTLREEVFNGVWKPGEKLRESSLAERFGVSRNSLREAISILAEQGILHKSVQRGASVPVFSERDIFDIFDARRLIEEAGIRKIIASKAVPQRMMALHEVLASAEQNAPRMEIVSVDMDFH